MRVGGEESEALRDREPTARAKLAVTAGAGCRPGVGTQCWALHYH